MPANPLWAWVRWVLKGTFGSVMDSFSREKCGGFLWSTFGHGWNAGTKMWRILFDPRLVTIEMLGRRKFKIFSHEWKCREESFQWWKRVSDKNFDRLSGEEKLGFPCRSLKRFGEKKFHGIPRFEGFVLLPNVFFRLWNSIQFLKASVDMWLSYLFIYFIL